MSEIDGRDELLQAHLEGEIDETELRRRLGGETGSPGLEAELRAYRAVWELAGEEPATRLSADFARRVARAAAAEAPSAGDRDALGVIVAAASLVSAGAAAAAAGLLLSMTGLDAGLLIAGVVGALTGTPAFVAGAAGTAALLLGVDRLWLSSAHPGSATP